MKNISVVLNVVLLVAVAVLYFLQFGNSAPEIEETTTTAKSGDYTIAYINSDSVLAKYEYFKDIQGKLEEKGAKLEKEYQNRAQGLQQEVNDYQRNVSNLTIGQAKALEENLLKKQQNLRVYQETLAQEIMREEAKFNQELYDKITSYLKEFGTNNGFDMVVKFNQGSDVLYATEGMDVTNDVIEGLNEAYKLEKADGQPATKTDSTTVK